MKNNCLPVFALVLITHAAWSADTPPAREELTVPGYTFCEPLGMRMPEYPKQALMDDVSGYIVLGFDLDGSGRAINPQVLKSSPPGVFDENSLAALQKLRFPEDFIAANCSYSWTFSVDD